MSCDFSREPSVGLPSRSLGEFKSEGSRCWRIPQSGLQSRRESQADNTQTRADGSWDRQGGTNSSWCHLSRCPLTAPSAVTTSAWARPLGGDEPGPPPHSPAAPGHGGCIVAEAPPRHPPRSMPAAPAPHSFRETRFLFRPCVPCSSDLGVCKTAGWPEKNTSWIPIPLLAKRARPSPLVAPNARLLCLEEKG